MTESPDIRRARRAARDAGMILQKKADKFILSRCDIDGGTRTVETEGALADIERELGIQPAGRPTRSSRCPGQRARRR